MTILLIVLLLVGCEVGTAVMAALVDGSTCGTRATADDTGSAFAPDPFTGVGMVCTSLGMAGNVCLLSHLMQL